MVIQQSPNSNRDPISCPGVTGPSIPWILDLFEFNPDLVGSMEWSLLLLALTWETLSPECRVDLVTGKSNSFVDGGC